MNICTLCGTNRRLNDLVTEKHGTVKVCGQCVAKLVEAAIEDREQWRKDFCHGCPQSAADGVCLQGVTAETCA